MRWSSVLVVAAAACDPGPNGTVNGDMTPDGGQDATRQDGQSGDQWQPVSCYLESFASCSGTDATASAIWGPLPPQCAGSHSCCFSPPGTSASGHATCAAGCAIQSHLEPTRYMALEPWLLTHPEVLCAETPEKYAGDSCDVNTPCLPVRAQLAADGTVASTAYLSCDTTSSKCVTASAPTIPNYLSSCSSYYGPDVFGIALPSVYTPSGDPCLYAWNASAQQQASGRTRICFGDWQCPAGSLCDDQIPLVPGTATSGPVAVCKPGPRGTLTPEMLTP